MQYSKFEERLRSELYEIHEAMDLDAFVKENKAYRKKKRRRTLFMFLSVVGILLISFGFISDKVFDSKSSEIEKTDNEILNSSVIALKNEDTLGSVKDKKGFSKSLSSEVKVKESTGLRSINIQKQKEIFKNETSSQTKSIQIDENESEYLNEEYDDRIKHSTKEISRSNEIYSLLAQRKTLGLISTKSLFDLSISKKECYDFGRPDWTFDLGVEAGVFYPMKELDAKSPNEIIDSRLQNEKSLEGLRASVWTRISREDTPIYFKIGSSYSRIAEQLSLQYSITKLDTSQGIISITQSQNGDTLTIIKGNVITETTIEKKVKKHYYLHSINLPLAIGYELALDKFSLGLEAGVEINLSLMSSGYIQTGSSRITKAKNSDLFKQRIGLSYFANAYFLKPIFYNDAVFVSGGFKYNPSDISSNSNPNSQKYMSGGINIGYLHAF